MVCVKHGMKNGQPKTRCIYENGKLHRLYEKWHSDRSYEKTNISYTDGKLKERYKFEEQRTDGRIKIHIMCMNHITITIR